MPFRSRTILPNGLSSGANRSASALALTLAAENPVGCVVLEAPFTSAVDVGAQHYWFVPVRLLMKDQSLGFARWQGHRTGPGGARRERFDRPHGARQVPVWSDPGA